jgi:hypothetical protein
MHARYYSFNLGRFMSVDPVGGKVGSSQSWDAYSYVGDNPIDLADPTGKRARVMNEKAYHLLEEELGPDSKLLTKDKEGDLSLKATPAQLAHNEALKVLNDVIKAKEMYGISAGPTLPNAVGSLNLSKVGGAMNLSRTSDQRFTTTKVRVRQTPAAGFDAIIGVDPATLTKAVGDEGGRPVSPAKVLFHETAESFERTTHHRQYLPAHATAIRREATWMRQRPSLLKFAPGAGPLRFNIGN